MEFPENKQRNEIKKERYSQTSTISILIILIEQLVRTQALNDDMDLDRVLLNAVIASLDTYCNDHLPVAPDSKLIRYRVQEYLDLCDTIKLLKFEANKKETLENNNLGE